MERRSSIQPLSVHIDQSLVNLSTTTNQPAGPPVDNPAEVSADTEDESANQYSTINDTSLLNERQLSFVKPYFSNSKEALGEEGEEEEELCHSLEAVNLDNLMEDNIYSNLRRATPPIIRQDPFKPKIDNSECIYSDVEIIYSPLNPQLKPFASPLPQPVPLTPPCTLPQSVPIALPKPRYQHQHAANNCIQSGYNAQARAVREMEEAISSSICAPPTEAPGSFKHRLAEIISKDLAKFQPPLPFGAGSPTVSQ